LQRRLIKYQEKLFTFIHHDSVPSNNNNAENAIKRFAYYRENTAGIMKEAGLNDYLLLLSHLPDVPVQGDQLPEIPPVRGARHRRILLKKTEPAQEGAD
jgi:hypothetical protein